MFVLRTYRSLDPMKEASSSCHQERLHHVSLGAKAPNKLLGDDFAMLKNLWGKNLFFYKCPIGEGRAIWHRRAKLHSSIFRKLLYMCKLAIYALWIWRNSLRLTSTGRTILARPVLKCNPLFDVQPLWCNFALSRIFIIFSKRSCISWLRRSDKIFLYAFEITRTLH